MTKPARRNQTRFTSSRRNRHARRQPGWIGAFDILTDEDRIRICEALAEYRRGEFFNSDEIKAMLATDRI